MQNGSVLAIPLKSSWQITTKQMIEAMLIWHDLCLKIEFQIRNACPKPGTGFTTSYVVVFI